MSHVVISLGSNLGDSKQILNMAIDSISKILTEVKVSSIIETKPWGNLDQANFFNAVIVGKYVGTPMELLELLQNLESKAERIRTIKWGPRTLDLDIICFGTLEISTPQLTIPHPFAHERAFVLAPWLEIESKAALPNRGPVKNLLELLT